MKFYRKSRKNYPDGVLGIYDNGGKTIDRYTIVYKPFEYEGQLFFPFIGMNSQPFHPAYGFCQHGESKIRLVRGRGEKCIDFFDLPKDCQKVIKKYLGV